MDDLERLYNTHYAAVVRFLYRATLLSINGDSYRMRAHRERLQMLRAGMSPTATSLDGPT